MVGKCGRPRVGWQIDPFGHSREQASILSQMGFDAMLFARMDHDDKDKRIQNGDLNFLWKGSANIGTNIFIQNIFIIVFLLSMISGPHLYLCQVGLD